MSSARFRVVQPARRLRGELRVPGDKSITHRGLLLGAIGSGDSRVRRPGLGADTQATAGVVAALGISHAVHGDELVVRGRGFSGLREPSDVLSCDNSGTTLRLVSGILAGRPFHSFVTGDASLRRRPMGRVVEPLRAMGAQIHARADGTRAPMAFAPASLHGARLRSPVASAQVKSAVLLAALQADGPTSLEQPAPSRDHTERLLRAQGATVTFDDGTVSCTPNGPLAPLDLDIPGDFSSAAFWIAAAVVHPDAEITVRDVGLNPGRTGLLDVLRAMGADVRVEVERHEPEPVGTIMARSSTLKAADAGGDLVPRLIDEAPLVALLAAHADGESRLRDAAELAAKESNRLRTTAAALAALGVEVDEQPDGFVTAGGQRAGGGRADAAGDHRIAMLAAAAALSGSGPVTIDGADSAAVSYPGFWDDLALLSE
ncbi:MAG: 3-phosphoshikimate 1-carboxyvinyltransferase [Chloroflexi bacterium]|nr:3-phosphoshikimate 1-carboxyvinyltransferase [Chloroflexota bacterium]